MCRLFAIRHSEKISMTPYLEQFARLAQQSPEYQGHGWGIAYRVDGQKWAHDKNINPIWEDDMRRFPPTDMLIAHARSAFRDEGIVVENNMPFYDDDAIFVFNGELQGVRIREEGRIGAEKIFNFIKRFNRQGDLGAALQKGTEQLHKRTRYVRAMNIIMTDKARFYVSSSYAERPDYFQLVVNEDRSVIICSDPFPGESGWHPIPNHCFNIF
jgi:glutamine amidotransferase